MRKIEIIRHSLAHILALAVQEMYHGVKFGIGPNIENGFYYDFDFSEIKNTKHKAQNLSSEDLPKIEEKMRELIKKNLKFEKKEVSINKAKQIFKNQPYKLDLINSKTDIDNKNLFIYKIAEFIDLCKGPHIKSIKEISTDIFKLTKIAGAYWKGDEKNPMLTRIYGIAFNTKKELDKYLKQQKEAEKRDHRKIGKELDLFVFSDLVGKGLPLLTPKGTIIKEELQKKVEYICRNHGFQKVSTPHLAKIELYELSGHAKKFNEELFHVYSERKHNFAIRPVLCPHHSQIYASRSRSYKDLPIRYMESDKMYRAEKPGEIGGLNRVYAITVEDGHSFCEINEVKNEIKTIVNIIKEFYNSFHLWDKSLVYLSVKDSENPDKYIGEKKDWNWCEKALQEVSDEMNLKAKRQEGEAALYGPKLDFAFKDAMGKEIQIPTVQVDFATPKRFGLLYVNKKGEKEHPVMIHRAILGSYERFLALLIEHFNGALPLWLSPVQIWILPISDKNNKYVEKIAKKFQVAGFRFEVRCESETLSKKIRVGEIQKIPYILVVGNKEVEKIAKNIETRD